LAQSKTLPTTCSLTSSGIRNRYWHESPRHKPTFGFHRINDRNPRSPFQRN
jgi:hypothetical protein